MYVASYYALLERPVFDPMLAYLLWKGAGRTLDWPEVLGTPMSLTSGNRDKARQRISEFASGAGYSGREKDALLGELAGRLTRMAEPVNGTRTAFRNSVQGRQTTSTDRWAVLGVQIQYGHWVKSGAAIWCV